MPTYRYTAKTMDGKVVRGSMAAENPSKLSRRLMEKQLILLRSKETKQRQTAVQLGPMELSDFARELSVMTDAGVSVIRAVDILRGRENARHVQTVLDRLHASLSRGMVLSDAMKEQPGAFPELFVAMTLAGETSGKLSDNAQKMAELYEKDHRLNIKVKNAMTYPTVLMVVTVLVVLGIFTFILPNFFAAFEGMELPVTTRIIYAISRGITRYWYLLVAGALILVATIQMLGKQDAVAVFVGRLKLRLPKIGPLLRTIYTARIARNMSSLYASGLPIVKTLEICRRVAGNKYIDMKFDEVIHQVSNGVALSQAIRSVDGFDNKLPSVIQVGEETSRLDTMLASVADSLDYDAEMSTQRLLTLIEPLMIVAMAVIVGFIMVSVMLPIFQIYNNIQ